METITIFDYKEAATKTGQNAGAIYLSVDTDQGRMSCFETTIFEKIKEAKGMEVLLEVKTNGDFKNITLIGSVVGPGKEKPKDTHKSKESFGRTPDEIIRTDAFRLAVDLSIAGKIEQAQIESTANDLFTKIKG